MHNREITHTVKTVYQKINWL